MTTYSLFKTLHAPTGVENSIYCNFLNEKEQNLITSGSNQLQIYKLINSDVDSKKLKFELIKNYQLFGTISGIAKCRYGSMKKDALIVSFMDAKVSIISFNELNGEIDTIGMHFFEDEIESEGINFNYDHPILRVDPNMRCAVVLIYGFKLAIIPFNEDLNEKIGENEHEELNEAADEGKKVQINNNSSYVIDLRKLDNWLTMRIIDIEFLYGYYEPTLFILCESNRTWVGRYAVKKDTCNSISLSINLNQKTNPLIWPVDKLPSDCLKSIAVPQPIGGVLIFTVNGLIYINQSVPSYGVSLNSIGKTTTKYPFKNMENTKITLDCSHACFITTDQLVVSLKGGELYIITLITDTESLRSVRGFSIEKGPGSVIANCLIRCFDNYLFIGSRLGNSVLLRYNIKQQIIANDNELIIKQQETEIVEEIVELTNTNNNNNNNNNEDELDQILDINDEQLNTNINSYQFEICDILLNIAPCGNTLVGESYNDYHDYLKQTTMIDDLNEDQQPKQQQTQQQMNFNLIDLITSSGYSKNGSISILQRSIRPEIIVSFEIESIIDMWSIYSCNDESLSSTYLFLTKIDSTMILQITNEITELDKNLFCTKQATINVSNINARLIDASGGEGEVNNNDNFYKYILQITPTDMFVYDSNELLFSYKLNLESNIKSCTILDPYIVIQTESSDIYLYLLYEMPNKAKTFQIKLIDRELEELSGIQCFSIYRDFNDTFEMIKPNVNLDDTVEMYDLEDQFRRNSLSNPQHQTTTAAAMMTVDDEDELLYGGNENENKIEEIKIKENKREGEEELLSSRKSVKKEDRLKVPSYWLFTVTIENNFNIYNITFNSVNEEININIYFSFSKFSMAPKLLTNQLSSTFGNTNESSSTTTTTTTIQRESSLVVDPLSQPNVHEIQIVGLGSDQNKIYLISHIDEEIIIYEAFQASSENEKNINFRFKRVTHDILIRDRRRRKLQMKNKLFNLNQPQSSSSSSTSNNEQRTKHAPLIRQFNNIAGYNGCFINGLHPYFLFQCTRSGLTTHPLWFDGPINSFVPLKNSSITLSGFIYLNKKNDIRICTLPVDDFNGKCPIYYDSQWILRKIQLRQSVHSIIYHEESKTYTCITSVSESTNQLMQLGGEDKEVELYPRDENFILPHREQFSMQLYTSSNWEPLPLCKFVMSEWEHVTCLKLIKLPYEGHSSGFRSYIVVSTSNCYNEDVNSRGRIIIFDIIEVEPEPGQPLTSIKIKVNLSIPYHLFFIFKIFY